MSVQVYTIDRSDWDFLERVWSYCQAKDIPMYKTRLTNYNIAWVVELPNSSYTTMFLLNFGKYVTNVMGTYYV